MPSRFPGAMKWGSLGIIKFIIKHWYIFILLIIILPSIISSISLAKQQRNPSLPFLQVGLILTNADASISKDVDTLKTNPSELIGMEKPENGIWAKTKYRWKFFWNVIFRLIGSIWLITFPFMVFYKFFRWKGTKGAQSSVSHDMFSAIFWGLIFIFIINLVIVIHGLIEGSYLLVIPESMTFSQETWFIIKNTLPFHGLIKLVLYLFSLI